MKKYLMWQLFMLWSIGFLQAQITLNNGNFPVAGLSIARGYLISTPDLTGSAGSGQFYDFSSATPVLHDSILYANASQTPWYSFHPGTTVARHELLDNINYVYYYKATANAYLRTGLTLIGDFGQGPDTVHGNYSVNDTLISNQYSYGHIETEFASVTITNILPLTNYTIKTRRLITVDGWGQLKTPLNNYPHVLRIKCTEFRNDTAWSLGSPIYTARDTTFQYLYYAQNVRHPVVVANCNAIFKPFYYEYIYSPPQIMGCTDSNAINYNPLATVSDGSCIYCNLNTTISSDTSICYGASVTLTASGGTTYLWNTGSTLSSINIQPSESGVYSVLIGDGAYCSTVMSVSVNVAKPVSASFWTPVNHYGMAQVVQFVNLSENATDYLWDFDDVQNGSSTLQSPIHIYDSIGMKYVHLIASNICFADTTMDSILITDNTLIEILPAPAEIKIYPNPGSDGFFIDFNEYHFDWADLFLIDATGRKHILFQKRHTEDILSKKVETNHFLPGIYIVEIVTDRGVFVSKWLKQ